jgi:hypothetical protein
VLVEHCNVVEEIVFTGHAYYIRHLKVPVMIALGVMVGYKFVHASLLWLQLVMASQLIRVSLAHLSPTVAANVHTTHSSSYNTDNVQFVQKHNACLACWPSCKHECKNVAVRSALHIYI